MHTRKSEKKREWRGQKREEKERRDAIERLEEKRK
jgi:hypothetical protein